MVVEFRPFGGHHASPDEQKNLCFLLRHLGNPYHPITDLNKYFNPNYSNKLYDEIIVAVSSPVDKVIVHGTPHVDPFVTHVYVTIGFEPYRYYPHPCPHIDYKELVPFSRYHIVLGYVSKIG